MKLSLKILAIAVIAATTYSMIGCGAPATYSYSNVGITLTSHCVNCQGGQGSGDNVLFSSINPALEYMPSSAVGQGNTIELTANVTNAPATSVTWTVYPTNDVSQPTSLPSGSSATVGESGQSGQTGYINIQSSNTAFFTTPGSPPYYTGALLTQAQGMSYALTYQSPFSLLPGVGQSYQTIVEQMTGIPQGDVLVGASVQTDPANPASVATAYQLIQVFTASGTPTLYLVPQTPTTPSGLTTSVLTVPHGTTYQFYGGSIGAAPCIGSNQGQPGVTPGNCSNGSPNNTVNNSVVWEVGNNSVASSCSSSAIAGGSTAFGTISTAGLYTAPAAALPGTTTCIVLASSPFPAVSVLAYITIQ